MKLKMTALKPMEAEEAAGIRNVLAHVFVYGICFVAILPQQSPSPTQKTTQD